MPSLPALLPIIPFTGPVRGGVTLPGSKSITNRALILAALGSTTVTLRNALFSRDTRIMIAALRTLGFEITADESALTITITGGGGKIPQREAQIEVGNAGTAARFLTALVSLHPEGTYHFDGDEAMRRRPIGTLLEALEHQGATASARSFPFTLKTAGLRGGNVPLDATESSQLLSALLMVAPHARSPLTVQLKGETVSRPFVAMTERMVQQFSTPVVDYAIEGDATAASYFAALALVTQGQLTVNGLNLSPAALQGDAEFYRLLAAHQLITASDHQVASGPQRSSFSADFNHFSDTFLTLAALAPLLEGPTRITGIAHTRKQETDRVAGMARELRKLGQQVIETEDTLEIHPRPLTPHREIETYHDHRFAMSFGILGCYDLLRNGQAWLSIKDPACCAKTFPSFFDLLADLRGNSVLL
ncbi:MAG: 3-phosphoshikimate 1-carboxyvinyltransferase [Opitutaceae bacterium]